MRHQARRRAISEPDSTLRLVVTKAGDGNRDRFVEALRVYVDAMENSFRVGERDPAA